MLSKVHISLAIRLFLAVFTSAETICKGEELSVYNDFDIGKLTEKPCTKVHGNIIIQNLNTAKRMPNYWTIEELHGSLIIQNTTNLGDSVNLQNLRIIRAREDPAIVLQGNKGLRLAIGARLANVFTQSRITYHFIDNWPAFMTESQHYTLFHAAHENRPVFYTDNHFITKQCDEWYYRLWAGVFAVLCFLTACALIACSFYGRRIDRKKNL